MSAPQPSHGWSLGPMLMGLGLAAIIFSGGIPRTGLGDTHDPGPRAFPIGIGILLVLGGLYQGGVWLARDGGSGRGFDLSKLSSVVTDERNRDAFILIGGLILYLPGIAWLGFSLSTVLFSTGLMVRLGAPGKLAGGVSLLLVLGINLLFVGLFKVQFPTGLFGLPF
jgi:hypothetical protein